MTQQDAKRQIETIKKITEEALKTPESARKILVDAGIVKNNEKTVNKGYQNEVDGVPSTLSNHGLS